MSSQIPSDGKTLFAVIIPYFQKRPGILRATLASVAHQDLRQPIRIYVVDDASPAPLEPEISAVSWPAHIQVRPLRKPNGGPAQARNFALSRLEEESFVAFLDSDDTWEPHHLSSALYAFRNGFDYYAADTRIASTGKRYHSAFFKDSLPLEQYGSEPWAQQLTVPLINFTIKSPISGASCLVVTRDLLSGVRFEESLKTAGEDGLFATTLAAKRPKVMISTRVDATKGVGVNIFTTGDWGSREGLMRAIYFLRSRLLMRPLVKDFPDASHSLNTTIRQGRRDLWFNIVAATRRNNLAAWELAHIFYRDPQSLAAAPGVIREILAGTRRPSSGSGAH